MTHNTREVEEFSKKWHELGIPNGCLVQMREYHNHQLQKAREGEIEVLESVSRMCDGTNPTHEEIWHIVHDRLQTLINSELDQDSE